ncbi:MAG: methyltransferase domain-containing protein [Kiritimatiellae bacterium]|nr:methyltransferase domain-containing protein [Kiritimatiellia bacterium]
MDYQATQNRLSLTRRLRRWVNGLGRRHRCCICGKHFHRFSKFQGGWDAVSPYLKELKWTGSDFDHFWCPFCRSHDRERHMMLFMEKLGYWESFSGAAVLHLAPEKWIIQKIESLQPAQYVKGDLFPSREGVVKIDATDIPFPDGTFDWVLCNHVLEHVPDDARAMRELFRVLKKGGRAILQTPVAYRLETTRENEPDVLSDPEKRLATYGQEDHIRLYGMDFFERLKTAGFSVTTRTHAELLPDIDPLRYGVNGDEELILCTKN